MKKRTLFLFLALCLLGVQLLWGTPTADAATTSGICGDNLTWIYDDTTETLRISGTGPMYDWRSFPDAPWNDIHHKILTVIIEPGVTSVGSYAFSSFYELEHIEIPYGIMSIGKNAFEFCRNLSGISIPESVTTIDAYAFSDCIGLTGVILPESVSFVGKWAFDYCSCLNTLVILNPECQLYDDSFTLGSTSLITLYGASGSTVESYAGKYGYNFVPLIDGMCNLGTHCYIYGKCILCEKREIISGTCGESATWSLDVVEKSLTISGAGEISDFKNEKAPWYSYRKVIQTVVLEDGITAIGNFAFYQCDKMISVDIPHSVTAIGEKAFYDCKKLESIVLPSGLTTLGDQSFYWCNQLTRVIIPGSVEYFGYRAFYGTGLISVIIEDGVQYIGNEAFRDCGNLLSVTIPNSVTAIGERAFYWCADLPAITLPEGLTTIEKETFYACSELVKVTIPEQVTTIEDRAFYECNTLREVTFGDNVTTIGDDAFYNCSRLRNVSFPEGLISIGTSAFRSCNKMTSVRIPNSVTTIGERAFSVCSRLESVAIGTGVKEIGQSAFGQCEKLTGIWVDEKNPAYSCDEKGVLFDKEKTTLIQCPGAESGAYVIPHSVTSIGDYAFFRCGGVESVDIPSGITSIGNYVFYGCGELRTISIPESVTSINTAAFGNNNKLYHVHFTGHMPVIREGAFDECPNLKLCYREGTHGWRNCTYATELWDYTYTTDCIAFTYTCNDCGEAYTFASEDAHRWDEGVAIVAATCTEGGSTLLTCLDCGATKTEDVVPLGHEQKDLVYETEFYLEYSCRNGAHTFRIERDPRIAIMALMGVEAVIADEGQYPWVFGKDDSAMGCNVMKSSNQGVKSTASATTITFHAKADFVLSFSYGVSSQGQHDHLTIYLDDTVVADRISGTVTSNYTSDTLPAGKHSLTLTYTKNYLANEGTDSGYLYNIVAEALETGCSHSRVTFVEAKAATCEVPGNTAYVYCPGCETYFADEEMTSVISAEETLLPIIDHEYVYLGKDGVCHTIICSICYDAADEDHSYTDGMCICGKAETKEPVIMDECRVGHTLNLASDISVTFAVEKATLEGFDMDTVYLISKVDAYEGNVYVGERTFKILPVEKGNLYYFTLTGLTAVNMNDSIRSVLYGTKDGQEYYSERDDYSIADYAYGQLNKANGSESLKILCANLLRYGAYAQRFKSYRTDHLADAAMTQTHKALLSDMDAVTFKEHNVVLEDLEDPKITWAAKSLDLASKVTLKLIFSPANYTGNVEELSLRLTYVGVDGETKSAEIQGAELYNASYGVYAFSFDGLLAGELRTVVTAQIFEGETPVSCTMQYSADTYGNNKTGMLGDLCKALFAYSDSAKAYFAGV